MTHDALSAPTSTYRVHPNDLIVRPLDDEAVAFSRSSGATHHLPPLAACLVTFLIDRPYTLDTLTEAMLPFYADDESGSDDVQTIQALIAETLEKLGRLGLVSLQP